MSGLAERAKTLAEASLACDVQELEGETLERYYVALESRRDAIAEVNTVLKDQAPGQFPKLLFTGHVGCGKSSELAKIAQDERDRFQLIFVKTHEELRIGDLEYTDLYLLLIRQIEEALRALDLALDPILQSEFADWFKEVVEETERSLEGDIGLSTEASGGPKIPFLAKLLFTATARIKGGAKQTTKIREALKQNVGRLTTDINALLRDGAEQIKMKFPEKKGFLVIFDGLDRCSEEISKRLFVDSAAQLQELHCTIIYTVPISALYTLNAISRSFEIPYIIPMVNIYNRRGDDHNILLDAELEFNLNGLEAMASLVEHRVEIEAVFETRQQLRTLCEMSGGHLRFLMQLVRTACRIAKARNHDKIQHEDITYAINQLQFRFEREIDVTYYPVLAKIALKQQKVDSEVSPKLLYSTAVLEYNGSSRWIYPNPLVRRSTLFQAAFRDATENKQP
jgi:AAA ATPase domain